MGYDDYWGGSYWGGSYWGDSYWAEYGTAVTGGDSRRYYYPFPKSKTKDHKELFLMVKELLYTLKGE